MTQAKSAAEHTYNTWRDGMIEAYGYDKDDAPSTWEEVQHFPKEVAVWEATARAAIEFVAVPRTPAPHVCTRCGKDITDGVLVGDGVPPGRGEAQRFAHYECMHPESTGGET